MRIRAVRAASFLIAGALAVCLACGRPAPASGDEPPASPSPSPAAAATPEPAPSEERPAVTEVERPRPPSPPAPHRRPPPTQEVAPPSPRPAEEPAPRVIVKTLPARTALDLVFLDGVSSETSQVGDTFRARVSRDVAWDGMIAIPAGSIVHGEVTEVVSLKKIGGTAKLGLHFSELELPSGRVAIEATFAQQGKSETKKDAATIGGAAAGGALLGRILGKNTKGAVVGAVVGAAAGTAVAAKTKGQQVEIGAGTEVPVELSQPVEITLSQR